MAENRAGLEEGESWRMLTEGGEKSKLDISHVLFSWFRTVVERGPCVQTDREAQ